MRLTSKSPSIKPSRAKFAGFLLAGIGVTALLVGHLTTCHGTRPNNAPETLAAEAPQPAPKDAAATRSELPEAAGDVVEAKDLPGKQRKRVGKSRRKRVGKSRRKRVRRNQRMRVKRRKRAQAAKRRKQRVARRRRAQRARKRRAQTRAALRARKRTAVGRVARQTSVTEEGPRRGGKRGPGITVSMEYPRPDSGSGRGMRSQVPVIPILVPPLEKEFYPSPPPGVP